jgi:NhaA family Na+:H+ antiporter
MPHTNSNELHITNESDESLHSDRTRTNFDQHPPTTVKRRCRTADDIKTMMERESSSGVLPIHAKTEGPPDRARYVLDTAVSEIERDILSSRSLFDPRWIPRSPEEISVADRLAQEYEIPTRVAARRRVALHLVRFVRIVQRFFVFLQLGILTALIWANVDYGSYSRLWQGGDDPHDLTVHFFVNDVFMTLFFGMAMVHVATSLRPGGSLFPFKKAVAPLLGTLGGVVGPAMIYLALVGLEGSFESQSQGWAITIATDISIAWLVSTQVFKSGTHPAVEFLLLLAVADDVVGLIVIAVAFPSSDMHLIWLLLVMGSLLVCCGLRWGLKYEKWYLYVFIAGPISWFGLYKAGLHPALALCFVIPFIPGHNIEKFDHDCSLFVHFGLFFFGLCNAGVQFTEIGFVTLNISISLIVGKAIGILAFTMIGSVLCGFELPVGMSKRHLSLVGVISGTGLTVSLFVAELAFKEPNYRDQARLGALLSVLAAPIALLLSRFVWIDRVETEAQPCENTV